MAPIMPWGSTCRPDPCGDVIETNVSHSRTRLSLWSLVSGLWSLVEELGGACKQLISCLDGCNTERGTAIRPATRLLSLHLQPARILVWFIQEGTQRPADPQTLRPPDPQTPRPEPGPCELTEGWS